MRFALLGDHPAGLELAAVLDSSRHEVAAYTSRLKDHWTSCWPVARFVGDVEEVLADPSIDGVIVAGRSSLREEQLRRALQAERAVFCVYPPSEKLAAAYEASLIQKDTGALLLPVVVEGLHPVFSRLQELLRNGADVGDLLLVDLEWTGVFGDSPPEDNTGLVQTFPGWFLLQRLLGEITEVSAYALEDSADRRAPFLLSGKSGEGVLFRELFLHDPDRSECRLRVVGKKGNLDVWFPGCWDGPVYLNWVDSHGESRQESWETWDPWQDYLARVDSSLPPALPSESNSRHQESGFTFFRWEDCIRAMELDDAVRYSLQKRRTVQIEYPEATEETGFKGTMVLVGCSVMWMALVLLILSQWVPGLGYVTAVLLVLFLLLQGLRYLVTDPQERPTKH